MCVAISKHAELVNIGQRWLVKQGFSVVVTETNAVGCREIPDVIGFRSNCSAVIEAKATRRDFMRDSKKSARDKRSLALGNYRFFICPFGLIKPDELPDKWGLIYFDGRNTVDVSRPIGNLWAGKREYLNDNWLRFFHESCVNQEREMLFSIARRLS